MLLSTPSFYAPDMYLFPSLSLIGFTKEDFVTIESMDKDYIDGLMEKPTKACMIMMYDMVMELIDMRMDR